MPDFGGTTYLPELDRERLTTALGRVYVLMLDGNWRTLRQIACLVGCSEAGASARLRDLRKERIREQYPNDGIDSRREKNGLWLYRMRKPTPRPGVQMELF